MSMLCIDRLWSKDYIWVKLTVYPRLTVKLKARHTFMIKGQPSWKINYLEHCSSQMFLYLFSIIHIFHKYHKNIMLMYSQSHESVCKIQLLSGNWLRITNDLVTVYSKLLVICTALVMPFVVFLT